MDRIEQAQKTIKPAIDRAIEKYIADRKEKVPRFVQTHFSFAGALRLNRKAFGTDLLKAPANLFWAVPYAALSLSAALSKRAGCAKMSALVRKLPSGFETRVQKEVKWLIYTELLEIPFEQKARKSNHDALLAQIIKQRAIADLLTPELAKIHAKSQDPKFRATKSGSTISPGCSTCLTCCAPLQEQWQCSTSPPTVLFDTDARTRLTRFSGFCNPKIF
jgi:hypothetical protein